MEVLTNPRVQSLALAQRIPNDVFHVLLSHGKYQYISLRNFSQEQIPSLLLCTTIRTLTLQDPLNVSDEMLSHIDASLPSLTSFSVHVQNQQRTIRQNSAPVPQWQTAVPKQAPPLKGLPLPKGALAHAPAPAAPAALAPPPLAAAPAPLPPALPKQS